MRTILSIKQKEESSKNYKTFSVRIKAETLNQLDEISHMTNRSRNDVVNKCIALALENYKY